MIYAVRVVERKDLGWNPGQTCVVNASYLFPGGCAVYCDAVILTVEHEVGHIVAVESFVVFERVVDGEDRRIGWVKSEGSGEKEAEEK